MARRSRSETTADLILKTCSRFPPPRPPPLHDVIWRVFSRLHRRRLEEEPRGGAEIAERDVFGFDPENLLPLPASATSASPPLRDVIWRVFSRLHLSVIRAACRDGCAPPCSAIGLRQGGATPARRAAFGRTARARHSRARSPSAPHSGALAHFYTAGAEPRAPRVRRNGINTVKIPEQKFGILRSDNIKKFGVSLDIIELEDGRWAAIEVKLGEGQAEDAATHLLRLSKKVDTGKVGAPSFLLVLTGSEFAYRRKDGVVVCPLACLKP